MLIKLNSDWFHVIPSKMLETGLKNTVILLLFFATFINATEKPEIRDPALGKRVYRILPFSSAYPLDLPSLINSFLDKYIYKDSVTVNPLLRDGSGKNKTKKVQGRNIALEPDGGGGGNPQTGEPADPEASASGDATQTKAPVEKTTKPTQLGRTFYSKGNQKGAFSASKTTYRRQNANRRPSYQNWYYRKQTREQGYTRYSGRSMQGYESPQDHEANLKDEEEDGNRRDGYSLEQQLGRSISTKRRRKQGWSTGGMSGRTFDESLETGKEGESPPPSEGGADETGGGEDAGKEEEDAEVGTLPPYVEEEKKEGDGGDGDDDDGGENDGSKEEESNEILFLPAFKPGALRCVVEEADEEPLGKWKAIQIHVPDGKGYDKMDNLEEVGRQFREEILPCMHFNITYEAKGDPKPEGDYLFLDPNENNLTCSSFIGRVQDGGQRFGLSKECIEHSTGLILHQLMHALGWSHEQKRRDRDDFINVFWHNVKPHDAKELQIKQNALAGGPYDINSIMHFSRNWTQVSMGGYIFEAKTKDNNGTRPHVGSNDTLSAIDKIKLRNIYCPNLGDEDCEIGKPPKTKLVVPGWTHAGFKKKGSGEEEGKGKDGDDGEEGGGTGGDEVTEGGDGGEDEDETESPNPPVKESEVDA